jgi:cobalt/nickel transport system ATP-binding protein
MSCAIDARGLTFTYPNGHVALNEIDLHVEHGERVALLGPNGAGKTTLVLHLNGLLMGKGQLEVAGLEVNDKSVWELRARVGLVFQDPDDQLFMPTVREDVAFGPLNMGLSRAEAQERVLEALGIVRMAHAIDRAPHQLSMGERRRVAIATVLAMRPSLLVLDEPSANLDPRSRRELLEVLATIERTMLVVTHDMPFAASLCDRALILAGGTIVCDRPCLDVLADDELLHENDLELPDGFDLTQLSRTHGDRVAGSLLPGKTRYDRGNDPGGNAWESTTTSTSTATSTATAR